MLAGGPITWDSRKQKPLLNRLFAASNPVLHKWMKHIDIKYHAIWEWIKEMQIELQYISTEEQLSDILTKSLPYERFKQLRDKIGLVVF